MVLILVQLLVMILVVACVLRWVTNAPQNMPGNERQITLGFYTQALGELENTEKQGLLVKADADEARLELQRQMLGAERAVTAQAADKYAPRSDKKRLGLLTIILLIPLISWGLYALLGAPHLPQRSFAVWERRDPAGLNDTEKLVRLEVAAYRHPRDGVLLEKLGDAYLVAGRFQEAANTYGRSLALQGESVRLLLLHSAALTGYNGGVIVEDAEDDLRRALVLEPDNALAVIGLATAIEQNGQLQSAAALLQTFLRMFPDTPERGKITAHAAKLQRSLGGGKGESE